MNGLYKRGKIYWIAYRINGKLYRESTKTDKRREAEYISACRKKDVKEGNIPEIKKITTCELVELSKEYIQWTERQKSHKDKKAWINKFIDRVGNINVNDLNSRILDQIQSERLKHNKPSTVNRYMSCTKHMVNKGVEWGLVKPETLSQVRKVKQLKENNKRLRFLTIEECQTLIDCCQSHLKPMVTVAIHTGMRRGEILNLKWAHVDLKHEFILLDKTKNDDRREIPINTTLEEIFKNLPRVLESEYVFPNKYGKPFGDIKNSFHTALKKACINDFKFHDLRHTFASHLVMQGIDLKSVQELLGHKSLTMTMRYSHLSSGHKKKALNTLDKIMRNRQADNFVHNLFTISEDLPT